MKKRFTQKVAKSFTLIEMLVACFLISIALLGAYAGITKYSQQNKQARENFVASMLGQEGVEIVRNIRDANWVNGAAWDTGLTACNCTGTVGCEAEFDDTALVSYADWPTNGHYLYIENGTGFYRYVSGANDTKTPFRRQICIDTSVANELHIVVNMFWASHQTSIKEDLYDWK
ncbi:MAG: prepilin-type N-terminal cleavage/methylation domain-containing protein [Candidatus Pacebacteria bacterium]|nr:prepilin-type N-terminal cleavage/methylation domain-containing protein [Candidatus Paceibacterota bacterium]